ncbi:hypothetical protein PspLS_06468 [Pyricularia sp. CBS 133598]|nr:hypothetical protein PspLS_06468 [Pyricularia sp. CBS 133598]
MAATEHCVFCFEALTAHFEDREPLPLAAVEKSWAAYLAASNSAATKQPPAVRRVADLSADHSSGSSAASSTTSLAADTAATTPAGPSELSLSSSSAAPAPKESPLFVTLNTIHPRRGSQLRGCIGTFEPQPLEEGLASYALTSALHDTRFDPVRAAELPSLEVAVTLLTDFEDADDADDWVLGTHGLRISFYHSGRRYGATYLPDVAPEQGWTKEETLVSLMRKAGWMGRKDKWRDVDLKVVRYQGRKVSLEYTAYKAWRDWADENPAAATVA